ncbi:hypothetical protein FRC12_010734 [Ceratobasidium sp. 428]|nr:hypothetical protein FRC12_010734 [Ceratobasidium sp. 428]
MSILYPHGREATTPTLPSVPTSDDAKPKRKKLGGLVKSVSSLFRKGNKSKPKGPNTLVAEPISSTTELKTARLMFDASEKLDGDRYRASAGLGNGSESADALNELIDAHSESDLGSRFGSSDSFRWTLQSPKNRNRACRLQSSLDQLALGYPNLLDGHSCQAQRMVIYMVLQASATELNVRCTSHFVILPSGEYNCRSVFRRALDVIKTRTVRPIRPSEKVKVEVPNPVDFGSAKATQVQDTSVLPTFPVPDAVVTAHEDSTKVVVRLEDSDYQDSEPIKPSLLLPEYIPENSQPPAGSRSCLV